MDQLSALGVARAEFDRRLRQVEVADWDRPTPCADWNVRDLVLHVLGGLAMIPALLNGCTREEAEAILQGATVPEDFVAEFNRLADAQAEAFAAPGALERVCNHPRGDFPGAVLLGFRTGDFALHAWDLARAIGADETLNGELVAFVWDGIQPMLPVIGTLGAFGDGPSGTVPENAPLQTRLLDATGRRA